MARVSREQPVIVENVIQSLTGTHVVPRVEIRLLVERTSKDLDRETADEYCAALFEHLGEHSDDAYALEALLVLCLAHPDLLERHRISMPQEGRRLAVLLEKRGEADRAQTLLELLVARHPGHRALDQELNGVMRRSGNLERLVERHLSRAEEAMREGNRTEALRWLREVLALDGSRRDVARMVRDLRFEELQRRAAWRKRFQIAALACAVVAACAAGIWREGRIDRAYAEVPAAPTDDPAAMQRRLAAIDELIDDHPLWLGMWSAGRERTRLRTEIDRVQSERADRERRLAHERAQQESEAESERALARSLAEQYEFDRALEHFQSALAAAPADWARQAEVKRDIDAIVEWQKKNGAVAAKGGQK